MRIAPKGYPHIFMQQDIKTTAFPEIKDYEILGKIGEGGIAEIFQARQVSLDRLVAIKIISPDMVGDTDIVRRFDRESVTIANLNHPNIVHIIDKGIADGRYYFVMEYVDGKSFKEMINSPDYSQHDKLEIIIMALKGLDYAHKNGVIHRDVKPANILIDRHGNAMMADFGIAQIVKKPDYEQTHSDVIMGTLAYMSPEQRESSANVDQTTDIFSVGIMIYEILTGRRPVGRFKLPSEINPNLATRYDQIITKCLTENPKDRYQTAVELKDDILNLISGRVTGEVIPKGGYPGADTFVGKCRFLDTIKETKYGSTVLVENAETSELYVIKRNEKSSAGLKEARVLASLKHKNIINIFGAGGENKRMAIMMEYAQGGSLAGRMAKPYQYEKAMEIITQVAEGLDFAHKNNIIHGDLRPSNILFSREEMVRLTDFGFPPHYNMMEKNWYMPPERRVGRQGDIYSLGVILHQMIIGSNPNYDRSGKLILGKFQKSMPARLQNMLAKLLAIRTTMRYRSIEEFLQDWEEFNRSLFRTNSSSTPAPSAVAPAINKKIMLGIAIAGAAVIIILLLIILLK
jgi:serine/threonine protein kinase